MKQLSLVTQRRFSLLLASVALCLTARLSGAETQPTFYGSRVAPIFEKHCTTCHGAEKQKGGLRLDAFAHAKRGGDSGVAFQAGDPKASDLLRRIKLPASDDEVMPSDGKPLLSADEIKVIELWIAGGASETKLASEFADAPALPRAKAPRVALVGNWRARAAEIAAIEKATGLRLVARSADATDGLILRTASAPTRATDEALVQLKPVAEFIVEVELARTKITDASLATLAAMPNLRSLDLTRTAVTPVGLAQLVALKKLEILNLTATAVDEKTAAQLKTLPALKRLWLFSTPAEPAVEKKLANH